MKIINKKQFEKAMNEIKRPARGGRTSSVIPDKKKLMSKNACRGFK